MVEGRKEVEMALAAGNEFHSVYFINELADGDLLQQVGKKYPKIDITELSAELFSKISYRETTGGLIAVVKTKELRLTDLKLPDNPLILVLEAVEKPGNLGAILRTADAAAVDAVICCHIPSDIYNPNAIRSSLGTVFTVPLVVASNSETMSWLRSNKISTYCTNLHKAKDYHLQDYTGASAIVVGTEATGVSSEWAEFADQNVKIPMLGKIDSMNVSVATAIMVYEAKRQRDFK